MGHPTRGLLLGHVGWRILDLIGGRTCVDRVARLAAANRRTLMAEPDQGTVKERVGAVLDMVRPAIQADGGDVELVDVDDAGVVQVRLHGACIGCPSATITLQVGIERNLKERVPEVTQVVCV